MINAHCTHTHTHAHTHTHTIELLPPPLIPTGGGSPVGGSPNLPRQVPPTQSFPPPSNQPFNPFS